MSKTISTVTDSDTQKRREALERIKALQARVSARSADLTTEQAEAIAEELTLAAVEALRDRSEVTFERDLTRRP